MSLKLKSHTHKPRWAFYHCKHVGWTLWLWQYHLTWFRPNYEELKKLG